MNYNDIAITSLETITAFDITTGSYLFTLDELQNATIAQTQEKTDIVGRQGRKLSSLKRNKGVTISASNGLVSQGLLELQTGSKFADAQDAVVEWTDYITVRIANNTVTAATSYKAVGTAGAEIEGLYIKNPNGSLGTKLTQKGSSPATGEFTWNASTKSLAFASADTSGENAIISDGTELVAFYKRKIQASVLKNLSDKYSGKAELYIDAIAEDKCANIYHLQIHFPKSDVNGEFSFEMGDNQTVHQFEAEALSGACGTAGEFFSYTLFLENEADYVAS